MSAHTPRRLGLLVVSLALGVAGALPAQAQSSYVGTTFSGNVVRTPLTIGLLGTSGSGESPAIGVRAGTSIGERWGLDAEVTYPGRITNEHTLSLGSSLIGLEPVFGSTGLWVPPSQTTTHSVRHSTFTTMLWVRQQPTERLSLTYLGGIAFVRFDGTYRTESRLSSSFPLPVVPFEQESTSYYAGPSLGFDASIRLTPRLDIVPNVRLMIFRDLLVARPGVGVVWKF